MKHYMIQIVSVVCAYAEPNHGTCQQMHWFMQAPATFIANIWQHIYKYIQEKYKIQGGGDPARPGPAPRRPRRLVFCEYLVYMCLYLYICVYIYIYIYICYMFGISFAIGYHVMVHNIYHDSAIKCGTLFEGMTPWNVTQITKCRPFSLKARRCLRCVEKKW